MKLKVKVVSKNTIFLPKKSIQGTLKENDIVSCVLGRKYKFYAKIFRTTRSLAIVVPRSVRQGLDLYGEHGSLVINKLKIKKKRDRYSSLVKNNSLNISEICNRFHEWVIADLPKEILILKFRKGTRLKPLRIKKMIPLNEDFLVFLGLLEGEMLKSKHNGSGIYFSFSNTAPEIMRKVLEFLVLLGVDRNEIKFEIRVNNRNNEKCIVEFWKNSLGIKEDEIRTYVYSNVNERSGLCSVQCFSKILAELLLEVLENIEYIFREDDHYWAFLRGWAAADGSIHKKPNTKTIDSFQIAIKRESKQQLANRILIKLGFRYNIPKNNRGCIRISGFDNFLKLLEFDIFRFHKDRDNRFRRYLKRSRNVKMYKTLAQFDEYFTIKEFMEKTESRNYAPTFTKLLSYVRKGFLEISGDGKRNSPYYFKRSEKTGFIVDLLSRNIII